MRSLLLQPTIVFFAAFAPLFGLTEHPLASGSGVVRFVCPNGISATIYSADYLNERTQFADGYGTIELDNGRRLTVITDISDPLIQNKGDGRFHPFAAKDVVDMLCEIDYPDLGLDVEVYLLPYPRQNLLTSSASGASIYLSPHVAEIPRQVTAYIVAHEMGHVFQHAYLPRGARLRWAEYRRVRGITDETRFNGEAEHAYRPPEIFAEDFRVLFGGPTAHGGGEIENRDITAARDVAGLESFFTGLIPLSLAEPFVVEMGSYPNPFNPHTQIRVALRDDFLATGDPVTVRIYDVRGALVRELYAGRPTSNEVLVRWDGRDDRGRYVASAMYFGVAQAGDSKMTHKLLMIK